MKYGVDIMKMCSICKKNVAVVFVNKIVNGKQEVVGMCLSCAKKQGLSPLTEIMDNSGMSQEDLDNLNEQMMSMLEDIDLTKLTDSNNPLSGLFNQLGNNVSAIDNDADVDDQSKALALTKDNDIAKSDNIDNSTNNKDDIPKQKKSKKKKYLDSFGMNLTNKAFHHQIDQVVGRKREIDRVIQILNRRTKNNPILIGEAGVGKTSIAEGLAVRIANREVPVKLYDTEVYLLDLTSVVAGTQFRGQFEARMKSIIEEAKSCGNVILIIDEVHNIMGAGNAESGAMNAANILKPALARGELQVIGATTIDEYRKYIEKDSALERRFQPVFVEEPSVNDTIEILKGIKGYYEDYHKVIISNEVIETCVKLCDRYVTDRNFPDKAIDVLDEAGSRANLKNEGLVELASLKDELVTLQQAIAESSQKNEFEAAAEYKVKECKLQDQIKSLEQKTSNVIISVEDIASVIEAWTKIPVQKITEIEAEKLLHLEERLHRRVIGQDEAVKSLARTIRRNRSNFKKFKKPTSFIFVGPTGVGKTELVRTLASELFENDKALIRVDMSEFMEKHTVSKLIGAPPGYVGYDQGGQLTEKVRRNPYSVILLDEIEKAHPDVFNILLQILEDGRLTDSQGRVVHFENTVLVMTSNAGTTLKSIGIGFGANNNYSTLSNRVQDALKETFKPEFLNRIDETIIFTELNKDELKQIVDLMLKEIETEAMDKNIKLNISDSVKEFILEKGYDPKYGARPLRRAIQRYIEDDLAELYLKGAVKENSTVTLSMNDDKIIFE
jgi:ATP-dependent Clp protease ATP-binding subunit ClpA